MTEQTLSVCCNYGISYIALSPVNDVDVDRLCVCTRPTPHMQHPRQIAKTISKIYVRRAPAACVAFHISINISVTWPGTSITRIRQTMLKANNICRVMNLCRSSRSGPVDSPGLRCMIHNDMAISSNNIGFGSKLPKRNNLWAELGVWVVHALRRESCILNA